MAIGKLKYAFYVIILTYSLLYAQDPQTDDFDTIDDLIVYMNADSVDQRGFADNPVDHDSLTFSQSGFWWYASLGTYGREHADEWAFYEGSDNEPHWEENEINSSHSVFRFTPYEDPANGQNAWSITDGSGNVRAPWNMHGYTRFTFFAYVYCRNGVGDEVMPIFMTTDYFNAAGRSGVKFFYDSREESAPETSEDFVFDIGNGPDRVVATGSGGGSAPDSTWYFFMAVFDSALGNGTLKIYLNDPVTPIVSADKTNESCNRCDSFDPGRLGYSLWGSGSPSEEFWPDFDIYAMGWYADTLSVSEKTFVRDKIDCLLGNDNVNCVSRRPYLLRDN